MDDITAGSLPPTITLQESAPIGDSIHQFLRSGELSTLRIRFGGDEVDLGARWEEEGIADGATISIWYKPWEAEANRDLGLIVTTLGSNEVASASHALMTVAKLFDDASVTREAFWGHSGAPAIAAAIKRPGHHPCVARNGAAALKSLAALSNDETRRALF